MKIIKIFLSLSTFTTIIFADIYADFNKHLKAQEYFAACKDGKSIYLKGENNQEILSAIGEVCLKADYIYVLAMIQNRLRTSKDARNNSVIFSSIVLQKRLIYQFMYDNVDISTLALPVIEHPLSYAFVAIRDKEYRVISETPKIITFDRESKNYKVYIDFKAKGRVIIEEYSPDAKTITHRYL